MHRQFWIALLCSLCAVAMVIASCGDAQDSGFRSSDASDNGGGGGGGADATTTGDGGGPSLGGGDGSPNDPNAALVISPQNPSIDVTTGTPPPTVQFQVTVNGAAVSASFGIDRGELGTIDAATGKFSPRGTLGGKSTVTASYRGRQATTTVTVRLHAVQNGGAQLDAGGGSGGQGGVGGEGAGGPVSATTRAVLEGATSTLPGIGWLYPYDGTVWPRGILAPLLQWNANGHNFDAVYIHITETSYEYRGFFAKPAAAVSFQRHPIPQDVWRATAYSNAGEEVTVSLVFSEAGKAVGPITEKWKIAQATLKGTVYYNSYGTGLAKNYGGGLGGFSRFGGATLAIRGNSTDPALVAGSDGDLPNCRVCHSVAANGSILVTQHGDNYNASGAYTLAPPIRETNMAPTDGRFVFPAISPDGSLLFAHAPAAAAWTSDLYALPSGATVSSTGLPAGLHGAFPAFSPDGKRLAFNLQGGPGADQRSLATLEFDAVAKSFANLAVAHKPAVTTSSAVWPSFLPTSDGVVFELEVRGNGRDFGGTRSDCDKADACSNQGVRGELWWVSLATKQAHRLDKLNGVGALPTGANAHDDDATLNYEPTVNPVPSGGYAWVVFTSRRLYGNVSTINPFWSDPRYHDISTTPTPKKLWVAAIDLNAPAGTDPSHPAFYLPAQELMAGNSRGFWVVDPCRTTGGPCETGDECCGGFCRAGGDGGALVCTDQKPACAEEYEKCVVDGDCCQSGIRCINGRCLSPAPK